GLSQEPVMVSRRVGEPARYPPSRQLQELVRADDAKLRVALEVAHGRAQEGREPAVVVVQDREQTTARVARGVPQVRGGSRGSGIAVIPHPRVIEARGHRSKLS